MDQSPKTNTTSDKELLALWRQVLPKIAKELGEPPPEPKKVTYLRNEGSN